MIAVKYCLFPSLSTKVHQFLTDFLTKISVRTGFTNDSIPALLSKHLQDVAKSPERIDNHQYTRGYGHQRLVNVLSKLYSQLLGVEINSQTDILITVGAYLSLYYAFIGWLNPGDEVISEFK
uniref:AMP-binding domain-containing protein n=1 Tax=Meloidogyne hapla TaxID=6305 RepID=A0A1I8BT53_MELHA